jgi:hypothetical protein
MSYPEIRSGDCTSWTQKAPDIGNGPVGVSAADRKRYIVNSLMEETIASSQQLHHHFLQLFFNK